MYDLVSLGKKGVNWAANLEDYNRILNEECKEELGWRSPFKIYYGRKSKQLVKASLDCVDSDDNTVTTAPKKRELASHLKKVKKIRRRAKLYSKKLNDRMVKSHKRRHKAETFKVYMTQKFFLLYFAVLYTQKPILNLNLHELFQTPSFPVRNSAILTPKVSPPRAAKTSRDKRMWRHFTW